MLSVLSPVVTCDWELSNPEEAAITSVRVIFISTHTHMIHMCVYSCVDIIVFINFCQICSGLFCPSVVFRV